VRVEGQRIVEISKSLASYNALDAGVFRIGPGLIDALDRVYRIKGDCSLSDGVQALARRGEFFASDICGAPWIDVDTPEAARHAAHLIQLLGDSFEPSRGLVSADDYIGLGANAWGAVPSVLPLGALVGRGYAVATDAE
jgi:hypothetical protein